MHTAVSSFSDLALILKDAGKGLWHLVYSIVLAKLLLCWISNLALVVAVVLQSGWSTDWACSQLLKLRMWPLCCWWQSLWKGNGFIPTQRMFLFLQKYWACPCLSFVPQAGKIFPFNQSVSSWLWQCVLVYIRKQVIRHWVTWLIPPWMLLDGMQFDFFHIVHSRSWASETISGKLALWIILPLISQ